MPSKFMNHLSPKRSSNERRPFKELTFNKKSDRCILMFDSGEYCKEKLDAGHSSQSKG